MQSPPRSINSPEASGRPCGAAVILSILQMQLSDTNVFPKCTADHLHGTLMLICYRNIPVDVRGIQK